MDLTDSERQALAAMEGQFPGRRLRRLAGRPPAGLRPRWTVAFSGVLGFLLVAGGVLLGVAQAVLMGLLLLAWWLGPRLPGLLRRTGRLLAGSPPPAPPDAAR
jgi:hypothetical protein